MPFGVGKKKEEKPKEKSAIRSPMRIRTLSLLNPFESLMKKCKNPMRFSSFCINFCSKTKIGCGKCEQTFKVHIPQVDQDNYTEAIKDPECPKYVSKHFFRKKRCKSHIFASKL